MEKVAAFEVLGIDRGILPRRVYRGAAGNIRRYFPRRLPVALEKQARRRAGRGLMDRTATWRTFRLAGTRFRW